MYHIARCLLAFTVMEILRVLALSLTVALWWDPAWPKRYWFGIEHYQCDTVYKCIKLSETSACCTEPLAVVCFNGSLSDSVVEDVWDIFKIDGPVLGTLGCWVGTRPISVERYLRNSRLTDGMSTPWCWVEDIWDFQDWWLEPGRLGALSFNTTEMLILEYD